MEKLLTVKETAEVTGLNQQSIYRMCREKRIPHIKMGSRLLIDIKKLERGRF